MKYRVIAGPHLGLWLDNEPDVERRRLVLNWLGAAEHGPELLISYVWEKPTRGRRLYAADLVSAGVVIVFTYAVAPLALVTVVDVIDLGEGIAVE